MENKIHQVPASRSIYDQLIRVLSELKSLEDLEISDHGLASDSQHMIAKSQLEEQIQSLRLRYTEALEDEINVDIVAEVSALSALTRDYNTQSLLDSREA